PVLRPSRGARGVSTSGTTAQPEGVSPALQASDPTADRTLDRPPPPTHPDVDAPAQAAPEAEARKPAPMVMRRTRTAATPFAHLLAEAEASGLLSVPPRRAES
ncbi:MAG: hypothetical protein AB1938_33050, partial [Myxococcota bacterium]